MFLIHGKKIIIDLISRNKSIVVSTPTSAGKSWIAMAAGISDKKILYVCPAKPVAYQVGSHFVHMTPRYTFLLDNISHFSYSPQTVFLLEQFVQIELIF